MQRLGRRAGWLGLLLALAACGKRGNPLPPLPTTPQAVAGLRVSQRGDQLEISYVAPRATTGGVGLPVLEIELLEAQGGGDFGKLAERFRRKAAPGEALSERQALPPVGTVVRVMARARAHGQNSAFTPLKVLTVQPAPPVPQDLRARLVPEGIELSWAPLPEPQPSPSPPAPSAPSEEGTAPGASGSVATAPPAGTGEVEPPAEAAAQRAESAPPSTGARAVPGGPGSPAASPSPSPTPRPAPGFLVYRRSEDGEYAAPLGATPSPRPLFLDAAAPGAPRGCYVVRTVTSPDPLVESGNSEEICLEWKDGFPPAAPEGVAVLSRDGAIEISWSPSPEPDLDHYVVWRALDEGARGMLGQVVAPDTVFQDTAPPAGALATYTVVAVDKAGNESPASAGATLRLP